MPDTDTLMVLDMPTTDNLYLTPTSKWTDKHQTILVSVTRFQCLLLFWVTDS